MPLKNLDWIASMEKMEDIRLFSSLCVKKTRKGSFTSAQEIDALFRIALYDRPLTPLELSQCMGVSKPLISRLLENLRKKEYITKELTPGDGRSYCIQITGKGHTELIETYRYYEAPLLELEQGLGTERLHHLLSLISEANEYMLSQK